MNKVMIDLETYDTKPTAKIISIGAVLFDPEFNKIDLENTFYIELDTKLQTARTESPDTVEWWNEQSDEARKALNGKKSLAMGLLKLSKWLPKDCKPWGNGATFDITILENAYDQLMIPIPWKFWNIRDMRTIKALYESKFDLTMNSGAAHNALDDAIKQTQAVNAMWSKL